MKITHSEYFSRFYAILFLFILCADASSTPKYVSSPPLSEVVKTKVGDVKLGKVLVPLITWGADIRTIYANGNARSTTQNSIFRKLDLDLQLQREDVFVKQIENYLSGKSPYLRGTLGMINMASQLLSQDARTIPIVVYQLSESAGGDALVVKSGIKNASGLKGKTIAMQAYGPHVDYLSKILSDAGLSTKDVKIKWVPDLTGSDNSPMAAFYENDIDASLVIIPDALALTSGGNVGTGSEDSVRGARILLSTKTANRIISDVYAVRTDFFTDHKKQVQSFTHGLMLAQESVEKLHANKVAQNMEYKAMIKSAADILLDSPQATSDAEALYADAEHMNFDDNVKFFANPSYPRNFNRRVKDIQSSLVLIGLLNKPVALNDAQWNYSQFKSGLNNLGQAEAPRFNQSQVSTVIAKKQQQGTLKEGELFSFEVFFKPNQKSFSSDLYEEAFNKVIDLASTYGGAIITVEGHSDPLGFLKQKKNGSTPVVLRRIKQSAKNLSLTRAGSVRDSILNYAQSRKVQLDKSQFALVGHGISSPRNGICGEDPCAPKSEQEWRDNMRVEFRIIQVEAEADVFQPL